MSRATEQQATQQAGATTAGQGPDLDAEHDPDVAHRASRAALKRVADAGDPDSRAPTLEQRQAQRQKTNDESAAGLQTAVAYASKELLVLANDVDATMNAAADEAGWDRRLQRVNDHVSVVLDGVDRLSRELGLAKTAQVPMAELKHSLAVFDRAYTVFANRVHQAENAAQRNHQPFATKIGALQQPIDELYKSMGWTATSLGASLADATPGASSLSSLDKASQDTVLAQALDANLAAMADSARMARMSLSGVGEDVTDRDLGRAIAHVLEVSNLVAQADAKMVIAHKKQIGVAVDEMQHLEQEVSAKPALAQLATRLTASGIRNKLLTIKGKLR